MIGLKGFLSDLDDSLLYKLRIARVFHHYYYSLENWSRTALSNLSLLGKSIAISFWDPLRRTRDLEEEEEGFLWTTWQINDASAVTFISIGSAVNISSTWASPWNTLAGLTYRTLCLFFSQFWLASTTDSLARGSRSQSKRPLPCLLYCTSLGTAQHGWPSLRSRLQSQWKCGSIMETPHPSGSGFFTQHITSQSFSPARELYGSVGVCSWPYTWMLMEHNGEKARVSLVL